jgi:preprotein translocase subunit YajC
LTIFDAALLAAASNGSGEEGSGGGTSAMMLVFLGLMIAVMFFMSRRNKKQQQKQSDFRDSIAVGQRVMTAGGMVGVVSDVEGDVVTIMSPAGDQSAYVRRAIRSQVSDEEWEAMLAPYPADDEESEEAVEEDLDDAVAQDEEADDESADTEEPEGKGA